MRCYRASFTCRAVCFSVFASLSTFVLASPCLSQFSDGNPIQIWLDRGRDTYQAYLSCAVTVATNFASLSCAAPDDIFEASQPSCRELEGPFIVASKGLENAGFPAKALDRAALLALARPDVKAAILGAQIKRGCK